MIVLKSPREIERMRVPCRIVAEILGLLRESVKPGVTTLELEELAIRETKKHKAVPAFKGYAGYPYALCCSPNDRVIHGMPNATPLKEGDILSIDFGVLYDEFYGDSAITLPVGAISDTARALMTATEESLYCGIEQAVAGGRLYDISSAVQRHVEARGYSIVRDFVGHGIGKQLHEDPQVPNYGVAGRGISLKPGMVLAIEPMVNCGTYAVKVLQDGWTAVTADGSLSAHFEHTVAVTEHGPEILTRLA
ncbi:MAG: type I methionyl aminopeptidase [Geobacter sp.]|uniref:type I methionyl aminopeptidase n=1 Tax=Trichlorobacter sp. TaxID=2911007 RepID=UPI002A35948F|nr:type I methionyl aminopeptidase [Trichlorobacter sp.]MDY0383979.1 type I methionyl aminopeptidase [Trichlorobacter sp.]